MRPDPRDWHGVALSKLTRVLGEQQGAAVVVAVCAEMGLPTIASADDLRRFAGALAARGGFEAALAGMLSVHATMYSEPTDAKRYA